MRMRHACRQGGSIGAKARALVGRRQYSLLSCGAAAAMPVVPVVARKAFEADRGHGPAARVPDLPMRFAGDSADRRRELVRDAGSAPGDPWCPTRGLSVPREPRHREPRASSAARDSSTHHAAASPAPVHRAFWVLLSRTWSRWADVLAIVKPATVIARPAVASHDSGRRSRNGSHAQRWRPRSSRLSYGWLARTRPGAVDGSPASCRSSGTASTRTRWRSTCRSRRPGLGALHKPVLPVSVGA